MSNHDLSTDLDLAYIQAHRDACEAIDRLHAEIHSGYVDSHGRRDWGQVMAMLVARAKCCDAQEAMNAAPPPCRWCGRVAGDPQCRCGVAKREPDNDVLLTGPFPEET